MKISSNFLKTTIQQEIERHNGCISFEYFMELALYHPEWGYYNQPTFDIGKQGDFTTAPVTSPLFARCFAHQLREIFKSFPVYQVLELGPGTGHFAKDLLLALKEFGISVQYYLYEKNLNLRQKQKKFFQLNCPQLLDHMIWLDQLPHEFKGIIIANEVLDALPVRCFTIKNHEIKERMVAFKNNEFIFEEAVPDFELKKIISTLCDTYDLPDHYTSEINLKLTPFLQSVIQSLSQGVILFSDYGYGQSEYYHPKRNQGTLTAFYQHQHHENVLARPGFQDITAHVDFTRVAEISTENACTLLGYTTQATFLLANDLIPYIEQAEVNLNEVERFHLHQTIKQLTFPTEMGERIKVMALAKALTCPLSGFEWSDRRMAL